MVNLKDLIEDWIQMRSTLQQQAKVFKAGEMRFEGILPDSSMESVIAHIENCIAELNSLLKKFAGTNWT